jgi:hypothetical protein
MRKSLNNKNRTRKNANTKTKTKRGGAGDSKSIKKCVNTFVKTKRKQYGKKTKDIRKMLEKEARLKFKNDKPKLNETLKRIKEFTKPSKESDKILTDSDILTFCNPNCEATILEPGNKLSERYYADYKSNKKLIKLFEEQRKKIFGKKTNVLVDGFYENAPKKYLDEIKKQGAISFCSPGTKIIK